MHPERSGDELFRLLVESVEDYAIFALDPDGRVMSWNRGAERLKGYSAEEIVGEHLSRFYLPEDVARGLPQANLGAAADRGTFSSEGWRVRKDGSLFWASVVITALRDHDGRLVAFAKVTRDLTARKQAEERLEQLRRQNEQILKAAGEGIVGLDSDERVSFANPAAAHLLGWSAEEMLGRDLHALVHGARPDGTPFPREQCPIRGSLRDGAPQRGADEIFWRKDGTPLQVAYFSSPIREDGRTVGAVVTFRDVSEERRAEERARALLREQTARQEAEESARWVRFLAEASSVLASTLDYEATLRNVGRLAVPRLADFCVVDVLDEEGHVRRLEAVHADPAQQERVRELLKFPPDAGLPGGVPEVLRENKSLLIAELSDEDLARSGRDEEHRRLLRALGTRSVVVVPLLAHGRAIGAISFVLTGADGRRYTEHDLAAAEELARRAAIAIDNAREHRAAEAARAEAEQARARATDILESITDSFFAVDAGWRFTYVNRVAEHTLGQSREELLGKGLWEVFPQLVGTRTEREYRRAMQERVVAHLEDPGPRGSTVFEMHAYPAGDGLAVYFRDVTGRKRVEQALRESEARFRAVFERSAIGIAVVGEDRRLRDANPAFLRMLGSGEEGLQGHPCDDLCPPEEARTEAALFAALVAGRRDQYTLETPFLRRDGRRIWGRLTVSLLERKEGEPVLALALLEDVTERREAEERLRMFESVVVHANDAVLITDAQLDEPGPRILHANAAFERMTGYAAAEVQGRSPRFMQGPKTDPAARARIRRALEEGRPVCEELVNYRKDGTEFLLEMSLVPIRDASGRVSQLAAVQRDVTERRRAQEAALRLGREAAARAEAEAARARMQTTLESITDAFYALDRAWRFTYVNRKAEEFLHQERGELLGRSLWETRPRLVGTAFEHHFRQAMAERRPQHFEAFAPWLDAWFEVRAYPWEEGLSVFFRDVTEQHQAQDAQRQLTAILEATPDVVAITDARGRGRYLNQAGRRLLGMGETEDVGQLSVAEIYPPWAARRLLSEAIPAALREGSWTGETALRTRDGREIPVSQVLLVHRDAQGQVEGISTVVRDILERKHAEEVQRFLAEASRSLVAALDYTATLESLARLAVQGIADACVVAVGEGDELRRVAAAHRDPARQHLLEAWDSVTLPARTPVGMLAVYLSGQPELVAEVSDAWMWAATLDERRYQAARALAPRSIMIVPLVARGRTLGTVTFVSCEGNRRYGPTDLTLAEGLAGRAALAIDNARLYELSQQATRLREEVLGVVSHDLRNPLTAISLNAQRLLAKLPEEGALGAERRKLETIERSAERAAHLIRDLLEVAKMQAGRLSMERAPVDIARLVEEAVEAHRSQAEEQGVRLETQLEEALPQLPADRYRLLQVFSNLLGNALKHTPQGGRVQVSARCSGSEVRFAVKDTGEGIAAEHLPLLFERFWQPHGAHEGAGLGLAIARGIVEGHGGRIWVESEVGRGSTFFFTIPVPGLPAAGAREGAP